MISYSLLEHWPFPSFADYGDACTGEMMHELGKRMDQVYVPLHRNQATDASEYEALLWQAQKPTSLFATM